jgi:hypothetical protein
MKSRRGPGLREGNHDATVADVRRAPPSLDAGRGPCSLIVRADARIHHPDRRACVACNILAEGIELGRRQILLQHADDRAYLASAASCQASTAPFSRGTMRGQRRSRQRASPSFAATRVCLRRSGDHRPGLSLVARPGSRWDRPNVVVKNPDFMSEAFSAGKVAGVYTSLSGTDAAR